MYQPLHHASVPIEDAPVGLVSRLVLLEDDELRQIVGGLGPNDNWTDSGPNGGWTD